MNIYDSGQGSFHLGMSNRKRSDNVALCLWRGFFMRCGTKAEFFVSKIVTEWSIRKTMTKTTADIYFLQRIYTGRNIIMWLGFCLAPMKLRRAWRERERARSSVRHHCQGCVPNLHKTILSDRIEFQRFVKMTKSVR